MMMYGGVKLMGMELTKGFLMFWGGLLGAALIFIVVTIYLVLSAKKAKRLLNDIAKEDF